jgi:hypothetical protein
MDKSSKIKIDFDKDFTPGPYPGQKHFTVLESGRYEVLYSNNIGVNRHFSFYHLESGSRIIINHHYDSLGIFKGEDYLFHIQCGIVESGNIPFKLLNT